MANGRDIRKGGPAWLNVLCLTLLASCTVSAQNDVRAYRSPNHIVMVLHRLQPNERWNGSLTYSEGAEKYGVVSWGSSCAVSRDGYLLTANHVVTGGDKYIVGGWTDTAKLVTAEIVKRNEVDDLAVIKVVPPNDMPWINESFAESGNVQEGVETFIWGYLGVQGGFMQFLRRGIVSNNTPLKPEDRVVYVETSASFGTSGSPAFLGDGRPLGIVTTSITLPGGLPLPAGVLGIIPGEKVNKILSEAGVTSTR